MPRPPETSGFAESPTPPSGEPIEVRRRRLRFRAWHRGTREADLLLGSFADRWIDRFDAGQLDRFEALLAMSDPDLYNWKTEREPVPPEHDHDVMDLLRAHAYTGPEAAGEPR
ncbi:MAG: succinate dehydrogenase assembly factor 2 [Azospirillaceae bacterium]